MWPLLTAAGEYCHSVLYNATTDELLFPAGSLVVALAAAGSNDVVDARNSPKRQQQQLGQLERQQRFFIGHSAFVSCLALGGQGTLLAAAQEGKQPLIRLWDCRRPEQGGGKCLAILCGEPCDTCGLGVHGASCLAGILGISASSSRHAQQGRPA
jgi:hypothetical protein